MPSASKNGAYHSQKPASAAKLEMPRGIVESLRVLKRELPCLLSEHEGEWVAVSRKGVLRLGSSQEELYQWCCIEMKLPEDEFAVRYITPDAFEDYVEPADKSLLQSHTN